MPNGRNEDKPTNTVANILKNKEEQDRVDAIIAEQREEYIKALNGMASTEYGKFVLEILIKVSGVHEPFNALDPKSLLRASDRNFYLNFIRPFLEPKLRKELEN